MTWFEDLVEGVISSRDKFWKNFKNSVQFQAIFRNKPHRKFAKITRKKTKTFAENLKKILNKEIFNIFLIILTI